MRLVFMGSPDLAAVILKMLYENGCEIVGVVTGTDKSRGRKSTLIPTEVGKLAQELGLPLLKTPRVRRPEDLAWIREKNADAVIVAAFGQLLPAELLKMTKFGCINVHASLLPAYRGAAPIQWSVLDGKTQTGVTIMQMDEGLDTGDILSQTVVPVDEEDTSGTLFEKMAEAGGKLLLETLPAFANGTVKPVIQPAYLDGKMLKIWKASVREDAAERKNSGAEPGTILCAGKEGIEVQTGSGTILLTEVQLEGKKRMNAADFLRGYRIRSDRLGMHG